VSSRVHVILLDLREVPFAGGVHDISLGRSPWAAFASLVFMISL
jgi:hypothetical protein